MRCSFIQKSRHWHLVLFCGNCRRRHFSLSKTVMVTVQTLQKRKIASNQCKDSSNTKEQEREKWGDMKVNFRPSGSHWLHNGHIPHTQNIRIYFVLLCLPHSVPFPNEIYYACLSWLDREGLTPHTMKTYLAVNCYMHITLDLPEPQEFTSLPCLWQVQSDIVHLFTWVLHDSKVSPNYTCHS